MMRQYELVERVLSYDPKADEALLNRAYVYAMRAHGHQRRASGDPYFSHPLEVAAILTELRLDDATIAAALLHDVIEDTDATRAEIDQLFGPEIGALVDGLTKIKRLDLVSKRAEQAENFRKLLIAISTDIRVLLVKLADRLHNMRTMEHMKPASRERISQETLDIYAPLAGRMGMQHLREELEDLSFRWLYPDAYKAVVDKLDTLRKRNSGLIGEIAGALGQRLGEAKIRHEISGREKKPYSIWSKMQNKQIGLEQLSDIYAFRVITDSVGDCYRVLGVAHTTWRTVPGRFKDYVSTPKQNGYQSVHTTVVGPRHQRVEMQIRTREMHQVAEYGVAAHAIYKDASKRTPEELAKDKNGGPYVWLRHLVETLLEGANPEEFLEHTKLELFQDQVFCFTPKGRLIALPRNATPIDFAYAVHTDVGNETTGAIINGRQMPIDTKLRNGDEVEILTSPGHTPPATWEGLAITGRARSAIRRAAREAVRKQYAELGRGLVSAAFGRAGVEYTDEKLKRVIARLAHRSLDDVLAAVARNELPVADVLKAVAPDAKLTAPDAVNRPRNRLERIPAETAQAQEGWFNLTKVLNLKFRDPSTTGDPNGKGIGIPIRGFRGDLPVSFEEGGAVPGDRIVGVQVPGQGIKIFQIHSPRLKDHEHDSWIDVAWSTDPARPERFPARISVTARNEPGTLAQIAQVIGEADGNIDNLRMVSRAIDFTEMQIELEVWDLAHLNQIIAGLKAKPVVSSAERVFG
jgi:GTP pyrophosphokinase